ncbi:MAG: diacylglycerol kinase family protein [Crocinitomicaceae bacterium]|nr:diacylglycerol kinase family protein [Crocinitomicaceae bacterium]
MTKFFNAFVFAFRGIGLMIRHDRNFKFHLFALLCVVSLGIYLNIAAADWITIILTSLLVLSLEAINAALEKLCDEITEERKESIRNIKDIAAGAVLISAIGAVAIAGFVFYPYLVACSCT